MSNPTKLSRSISKLAERFNIRQVSDWQQIPPHWVLQSPGCGQKTLDALRIYLADLGYTLRDDATAQQWQLAFSDDTAPIPSDFVVLVDQMEKCPFTFQGLRHDADRQRRPMAVQTRVVSLGASHADYQILGFEGQCAIERKSLEDAQQTFLSHGERRERFERELAFLASIECAAIVIECTRGELYGSVEARGRRSEADLARSLQRTVAAWEQDYRVPFVFCDSRRLAEVECFRRLQRFHRKHTEESTRVVEQSDVTAIIASL
jgi:hypothetical protein